MYVEKQKDDCLKSKTIHMQNAIILEQIIKIVHILYVHMLLICLTLHDTMECRPPSSSVYGILQAVGGHFFLQGIFPFHESNLGLLNYIYLDSLPSEPSGKPILYALFLII